MDESNFNIGNIKIQYGITLVHDLLNAGYTVSDFEQIIEEPTISTCNLYKDNQIIAILSFYNIKDKITVDQLANIPIDLVLPRRIRKNAKRKALSPAQTQKNRIIYTVRIHLIAATIFFCVYAFPVLFAWVQNTDFRLIGRMPMGMFLIVLPTVLIAFIWCGDVISEKGNVSKKILLSLGIMLNVIISLVYLILIDNAFTHRFF